MYRKKNDSDTWHWRPDCSNWPTGEYTTRANKPTTGELCNQCLSKDRLDTAREVVRRVRSKRR